MSKLIRANKKINSGLIKTSKDEGIILKTFFNILEEYNKQLEYKDLVLTKQELWNLSGFSGEYKSEKFNKLVESLTDSKTYHLKNNHTISGSMFVTEILKDDKIKIEVPRTYQKYLFYKRDIDLMTKAKRKESMDIKELDYYDKEVKPKSKELVLINKAHILGLKGKYNIRLYTLLKQWDKIGKYEKNWTEFKEIMEFPNTTKATRITEHLNKSKTELLKANIEITSIEKVKKGRSIDKIIFRFKNLEKEEKKKEVIKKVEEAKPLTPEEIAVNKTLTRLFLKMNGYTVRDLGDTEINNKLNEFIEENK